MALSSELKVGALFFIGLGLSVYFTFQTTKTSHAKGEYQVSFKRIARLAPGDPVTYNGVKVGTVAQVSPILDVGPEGIGEPRVQVAFAVDHNLRNAVLVGPATRFRINQGLLGGASLEIISTSGQPIAADQLKGRLGEDPASIDEALIAIRQLIDENRQGVHETIQSAKGAMDNFGAAAKEVKDTVAQNRDDIRATVVSVRQTAEKLPPLADRMGALVDELRATVAENREQLRQAMAGIASFTPKLNQIADDVKKISAQIAAGKGTVGKLVMEDTAHEKAIQVMDNANQRLEEIKPFTEGFSAVRMSLGVEGGWNATTGAGRGAAYVRVEPRPWKFYEGGISYRTAPDDREVVKDDPNKLGIDFSLLLGWRWFPDDDKQLYRLNTAVGIIDTKIGGWAYIPYDQRWGLRLLARMKDSDRQPTDRRYEHGNVLVRPTLVYRPWDRLWIEAGVDDLTDHPAPWLGVRLEVLDNDARNLTSASALGR